jgi:hypothetical protein
VHSPLSLSDAVPVACCDCQLLNVALRGASVALQLSHREGFEVKVRHLTLSQAYSPVELGRDPVLCLLAQSVQSGRTREFPYSPAGLS